jgi:peptide/nickel transport system substrate-binding protein
MKFLNWRCGLVLLSIFGCSLGVLAEGYSQAPSLDARVASGELPPVEERLPQVPLTLDFAANNQKPGQYGGKLSMLMGKEKDTRRMTVYGYARLVRYNEQLDLVPDIV